MESNAIGSIRKTRLVSFASFLLGCLGAAWGADPAVKTVRVIYIKPNDVALDPKYPQGIAEVMRESQKYYLSQCKFTFRLNEPVVEVVNGTHPRSWYENTERAGTDRYWWAVYNAQDDLLNLVPSIKSDGNRSKWKIVFYIDAEGPEAGGGGGGGWVLLPKHDADGALGYPKDKARWVGGMSHELGHCFGLPDAKSTDGTVMSASFYSWPNCILNASMVGAIQNLAANSGFWVSEIPSGIVFARAGSYVRRGVSPSALPVLTPEMLLGRKASWIMAEWPGLR